MEFKCSTLAPLEQIETCHMAGYPCFDRWHSLGADNPIYTVIASSSQRMNVPF